MYMVSYSIKPENDMIYSSDIGFHKNKNLIQQHFSLLTIFFEKA